MPTKQQLRQHVRKLKQKFLTAHTIAEQLEISERILTALQQTDAFQQAQTILAYYSLPDELHTLPFLNRWTTQKTILLPKVVGDELTIHPYTGAESVAPGAFGINEPTTPPFTDYQAIDLVVVPGVAFDPQGNRLGRGRGYYDKLFAHLLPADTKRIGVCYPFQLLPNIPTEPTDVTMDAVVYQGE